MLRKILAGVAGVVVAGLVVYAVEWAGHAVYPPPDGLDFADPEQMAPYVAGLPVGAFAFVLAAWALGAFIGTFVACRIGTARPQIYAAVVAGLILVGAIANMVVIPHPVWFMIAAVVLITAAGWLAARVSARPG